MRNIAQWTPGSTDDSGYSALGFGLSGYVDEVAVDDTHQLAYAGGQFTFACGDAACSSSTEDTIMLNRVGVFDLRTRSWSALADNGGVGTNGSATALLVDEATVYVGGGFTATGGGTSLLRAARWTWAPPSGSAIVADGPGSRVALPGTALIGVNSVTVGGVPAVVDYAASSGTSVTITLPSGLGPGSYPIVADAVGGMGTIGTYMVDTPPPVLPADPPRDASAVAGDASARVSWSPPASSGSFPITNYRATSSPDGKACLVAAPALECELVGLTNGTTYRFTVQALNGAGWSATSAPSDAVTPSRAPEESILITGTRTKRLAVVSGTTTGFGMGAMLTPWIRLSASGAFERGKVDVLVSSDGTFTWERRMRPGRPLEVYFTGGGVRSNTLVLN